MRHVQITFRHVHPSETARALADQKFEKLCQQLSGAPRCHVVLHRSVAGQSKGAHVHARIDILGAGIPIASEAHDLDVCVAIRAAFERAQAQAARGLDSRAIARAGRRPRPLLARPRRAARRSSV